MVPQKSESFLSLMEVYFSLNVELRLTIDAR